MLKISLPRVFIAFEKLIKHGLSTHVMTLFIFYEYSNMAGFSITMNITKTINRTSTTASRSLYMFLPTIHRAIKKSHKSRFHDCITGLLKVIDFDLPVSV